MRVIPLSWNPVCWHKTLSNFKEIKSNLRHLFGPAQKNKWVLFFWRQKKIHCFLTCRPSTTCPRLRQEAPMKSLTSSNVFWNWRTSCTNKKGRSLLSLFVRRDLFNYFSEDDGIGSLSVNKEFECKVEKR